MSEPFPRLGPGGLGETCHPYPSAPWRGQENPRYMGIQGGVPVPPLGSCAISCGLLTLSAPQFSHL